MARLFENSPSWSHLEHLSLSVKIPHDLLLELFRSLPSSLHSLELRDMLVYDAQELLTQISKILELDHVCIKCIRHQDLEVDECCCACTDGSDVCEPYERAVKAYLLRQRDVLIRMEFLSLWETSSESEMDEDAFHGDFDSLEAEDFPRPKCDACTSEF